MSGRTAVGNAPVNGDATAPTPTPEVLAGVLAPADQIKELQAALKAARAAAAAEREAAKAAKAAVAAAPTARDYIRAVDAAILGAVGDLEVWATVPADLLAEVRQSVANQLHHLSNKTAGWVGDLPKPDRSDWR